MAIKPINNKSLISSQLVNRGLQTSTKDVNGSVGVSISDS